MCNIIWISLQCRLQEMFVLPMTHPFWIKYNFQLSRVEFSAVHWQCPHCQHSLGWPLRPYGSFGLDLDQTEVLSGLFVPLHFRSREQKVHRENFRSRGTFVLWNIRSRGTKSPRTFVPWNFRSSGANVPRTFAPWNFRTRGMFRNNFLAL